MKNTKSRNSIIEILENSSVPLSAEEIYKLSPIKNINLSTIYRNLNIYAKNKIIKKEISDKGIAYYLIISKEHHHFLECTKCHKQIELEDCPFEIIHEKIEDDLGFVIDDQSTMIYGTCKKCNKK